MIWTEKTLSEALGVNINFKIYGERIQFNSTSVEKNDIFIALKGKTDGHDYVSHALKQGASVAIVSKKTLDATNIVIVEDTFAALQKMAAFKRNKSQAKFIAITGSVGKTSTKDAINTVLSAFDKVFASRGNFNNYLGVLINLASMADDIKYAILEIGMNHSGEISELTKMIKPDIAIITNISEAHLEFFNTMEDLVQAKCEIFEGLSKNGIAIINRDDRFYTNVMLSLPTEAILQTYSSMQPSNAKLELYENLKGTTHLIYKINNTEVEVRVAFIPKHYAQNFTIALLVSNILGKDLQKVALQLKKITLTRGRGEIVNVRKGEKNYQLICDYYNASPASLKASLEYLKQQNNKKKIAIIGEMLELGNTSPELHKDLTPYIIDSGCFKVILVGALTKHILNTLPQEIEKIYFDNVDLLTNNLNRVLDEDTIILIKGSRGVKLEKILSYFES